MYDHSNATAKTTAGMAAGKAAIMIPLPGQLEQTRNAEAMQDAGAARMIPQSELSGERLAKEIVALVETPEEITSIEDAARKMGRRDAAAVTVDLIEGVVSKK